MTRYPVLLVALAAIWGASYLFIKVAVDEVEPATMTAARLLLAAIVLLGFLVWRSSPREAAADLRAAWRPALVLGVVNAALPFWLVAWGEQHVDSTIAGIAQASLPIFVLVLGLRFLPHERVGSGRIAGIGLGILGVGVLTGFNPDRGWWAVAGTLAVVVSSLSYASGSVFGQLRVRSVAGPVLAAGSMLVGGLILLPPALLQLPDAVPGWKAIGSIVALSLLGTALAQLLLYRMLKLHGSARASLVTYLIPGFAVGYGALLLDEEIGVAALGGLALILGGVALGSGALRLPRRSGLPAPTP